MTFSDLQDRVNKFAALELPGQPQEMHLDTNFLVGDLWRAVQAGVATYDEATKTIDRLKAENDALPRLCPQPKKRTPNMTLTERRAEFIYDAARLAATHAKAPIVPVPWAEREQPFKDQFLEVIEKQCGPERSSSPEELHQSWMDAYFAMGWIYGEVHDPLLRRHPDLVPYDKLGKLEQDKDSVFVALCEIARLWIYNPEGYSDP